MMEEPQLKKLRRQKRSRIWSFPKRASWRGMSMIWDKIIPMVINWQILCLVGKLDLLLQHIAGLKEMKKRTGRILMEVQSMKVKEEYDVIERCAQEDQAKMKLV